jgi:hypothetical protein
MILSWVEYEEQDEDKEENDQQQVGAPDPLHPSSPNIPFSSALFVCPIGIIGGK